ncbi:SMI1/KNR4 family protein [Gracilibacillus oryzae]|uniref:SMI1/KNR4 family protein n=1 Tax=Gracilibacillus oryzae TaxID=1672701 RepID=A0A7C8KYB2_9BACI|nr:SMI1/KNR4 family protein [Gracilibacillus oryzae]KAB8135737.1 SMI1/KNR4 family protein [Gracilibacillus oryzae]
MAYFENFDLTDFWDDDEYAKENYISAPPDDEMIKQIETQLGYKLPSSYIWLMKQHNGGVPHKTCYPTSVPTTWAEDHIAITGIYGIGFEKSYSLGGDTGSEFWLEEWEYPNIGVAIADTPTAGHNMIFLDYRECGPEGEPCVVQIDQENDYEITWVAKDFESFIRGLVHEDEFE